MINPSEKFELKNLNLFNVFIENELIKMNPDYLKPLNIPYDIKTNLLLGANEEHRMLKAQLGVEIRVKDTENNIELVNSNIYEIKTAFLFQIENFSEVVEIIPETKMVLNKEMLTIIGSVCYSTSRGIILSRLANTKFSDCILPLINPDFKNPE